MATPKKNPVQNKRAYKTLVLKLNRDSLNMHNALDLENRYEEISQEQYQAYLVHHMLITTSNFVASMVDHLEWIKSNMDMGKEFTPQMMLAEVKSLIECCDRFSLENYPPTHFKDVEEFVNGLQEIKNVQDVEEFATNLNEIKNEVNEKATQ